MFGFGLMQLVAYGTQDIEEKKDKKGRKKRCKHYENIQNKKINEKINKKCNNYKKIKITYSDNCAFCLSKMNISNIVFETKCGHKFHQKCLKEYLKYNCQHKILNDNCPLCRCNI